MPVIDGIAQPGIVEKLTIAGTNIFFRNYSVNADLNLGLPSAPVSVKWGVKDNHFFVQLGTGTSAVFRIYTLDRAAEGAIYVAGVVPVATLVKTLPVSALNVTVCVATYNFNQTATAIYFHVKAVGPAPYAVTFEGVEPTNNSTASKVTTFILTSALLDTPSAFGGAGTVSAMITPENAVLDGDLNLLVPFQMVWNAWRPMASGAPTYTGASVLLQPTPSDCILDTLTWDSINFIQPNLANFANNETHAGIVNLEKNTIVYSTLPSIITRQATKSGRNYGISTTGTTSTPDATHVGLNYYTITASGTGADGCFNGNLGISNGAVQFGDLGIVGRIVHQLTLYPDTFQFVSATSLSEAVDTAISRSDSQVVWTYTKREMTERWRLTTVLVPLTGRRSSGPISGNLLAAVLKVSQIPTNAIAAWAADVQKDGWFLLRGSGLGTSTTLRAMQASAPTVTLRSFNQKYLLWSIPGFVYRTTLETGATVEVGTDITKFTGRSLTLINPTYLYSLDETNDDEGIEGHFFVDIESTPLPTTGLPVAGSLVKWEMFNPVDDLRHL